MTARVFPPKVQAFEPGARERPDTRGPNRFMLWLLWQQRRLLAATALVVLIWQLPNALVPWLLGRAVQEGIVAHDAGRTLGASLVLLGVVVVGVLGGIAAHTAAVSGWLVSMYRAMALTVRKALELGHVLARRTPTGEALSVASSDADTFGACAVMLPMAFGATANIVATIVIVLQLNWRMGVVVLIAAPFMVLGAAPLLRPLGEARTLERSRSSILTGQATDIVAGLRILRGIGGELTFGANYARQSQSVKRASLVAAAWQAGVDALAVLLSGLLLVLLTWFGLGEVEAGRLDTGGLVTFFGYAVALAWPLQTIFMFAQRWVQGLASAAKTIGVLGQADPWPEPEHPIALPRAALIRDEASGFEARPGELTVVVSGHPDESAALADRLGRYLPLVEDQAAPEFAAELKGRAARRDRAAKLAERARIAAADEARAREPWGVTVGGVDLASVSIREVRSAITVSDAGAGLFAGTLQECLDPLGLASRAQAEEALVAASALDVFEALPGGWQGRIDERGRGLSGGQRQRLVLARALLNAPDVLVLVEPTSAVDAHTEAAIAERLAAYRAGHTTIVMTASPLLLRHADTAVLLVDGRAVARGPHESLLRDNGAYRAVVARGMEDEQPASVEPEEGVR